MKVRERTDVVKDKLRPSTSGTTLLTVTTRTKRRWQMTMSTTARYSQVVTLRDTEHSLHESATCNRIGQISSSHRCRSVVRWQSHQCGTWSASRGSGYKSKCWFRWQQSGELEAYSDADQGGDKSTRRSVSGWAIMRGGHWLKVWAKKQQVVSLSSAENELYAAVAWDPEHGKGLGNIVWAETTRGWLSNNVFV